MAPGETPSAVIQELVGQLRRIEGFARKTAGEPLSEPEALSTGLEALDRMLPAGGFVRGSLVEWLAEGEGAGAAMLAIVLARPTLQAGGALVVVDAEGEFYAPAAAGLGVPLERTVVVRPSDSRDALWAFEQSLRCPGVAVSLYRAERLNGRQGRRLQLASEIGGGLGLLVRPLSARREPSWADVRLLVRPMPVVSSSSGRRWRMELLRCRGGMSGGELELELNDETGFVRVASPMAAPASVRHAAGA
ncbi:MAG: hypothetical protein ABIK89_05835 [Planctomycetota bacterium]